VDHVGHSVLLQDLKESMPLEENHLQVYQYNKLLIVALKMMDAMEEISHLLLHMLLRMVLNHGTVIHILLEMEFANINLT